MKIYFTAAIYQREKYIEEYKVIKRTIHDLGHRYFEAYDVIGKSLGAIRKETPDQRDNYYKRWQKLTSEIDVAIVEGSFPSSINIGLEVGALIEKGKPVIVLYQESLNPSFVDDLYSSRIIKIQYTLNSLAADLKWAFEEAEKMLHRRFTMLIPSQIDAFLERVVNERGVSRSEFIRSLIEREMGED